jgi:hypothetical protein
MINKSDITFACKYYKNEYNIAFELQICIFLFINLFY